MTAIRVNAPFDFFFDTSGRALSNGMVYIGKPGLNPETNPLPIFWDEAMAVPASQPIRTIGGAPSRNGSPGIIYVGQSYSIIVKDAGGSVVFSNLQSSQRISQFATVADLLASTATYLGFAGDIVEAGGFRYQIVTSGQHLTTAGGVKVKALPDSTGLDLRAFGAVLDGVSDTRSALALADAAAVAAGVPLVICGGWARVASNITLSADAKFVGVGIIRPSSGVTVTLANLVDAGALQIFDVTAGGAMKLTSPQDVRPEWWGSSNIALREAFKTSAAGSRIVLRGKLYESVSIVVNNDPLAADGADTGKVIEGVTPAQRYQMTGQFFGTRIRLANGQNANLFTVASGGANAYGSGGLRNVMLDGNKSQNTAGCGVQFDDVKDWSLHNVYSWNFKEDGLKFSGPNNQIDMSGFIELWNNDGRGLNGQAVGDPQWDASIRCVNNGGYDCYIASGMGRISQIYCYFGGGFRHDGDKPLSIEYLRVEDCDGAGAEFRGYLNVTDALLSDNGVNGSAGTNLCGAIVHPGAKVHIKNLSSANRNAAVHKQQYLVYSLGGECRIDNLNDDAFGAHGVANEQTLFVTNNSAIASTVSVGVRRAISGTYAALKDAGASVTPRPGTYDRYQITELTQSTTINNTTASNSPDGMELAFDITRDNVVASYNINWGSTYLSASGAALAATVVTAGQTARARFKRMGARWYLVAPIVVA